MGIRYIKLRSKIEVTNIEPEKNPRSIYTLTHIVIHIESYPRGAYIHWPILCSTSSPIPAEHIYTDPYCDPHRVLSPRSIYTLTHIVIHIESYPRGAYIHWPILWSTSSPIPAEHIYTDPYCDPHRVLSPRSIYTLTHIVIHIESYPRGAYIHWPILWSTSSPIPAEHIYTDPYCDPHRVLTPWSIYGGLDGGGGLEFGIQ